jgi:hypothetical protein
VDRRFLHLGQFGTEIRDHHIPAGKDTILCLHYEYLLPTRVRDLNPARGRRIILVAGPHHDTGQANADWMHRPIKLALIDPRRNHIAAVMTGHSGRDEFADQQPRNGRVSVRKVESVGAAIGVAG